jgi:photosynthetic reaction center M subunit
MAEYQNIFNRVQVRGPSYAGVPLREGSWWARAGKPFYLYTFGKLGDAQVGPILLGWTPSPRSSAASSPSRSSA